MKSDKLKIIKVLALAVSTIVTIWAMLRAAEWQIDFAAVALIGWAVSPYAALLAISVLLERFTSLRKINLVACVTAVLMLAFTLLIYIGTLGDSSSTYALIFIFVPL